MSIIESNPPVALALSRPRPHAQAINAYAPIFRTQQSKVDLDRILGVRAFDLQRVLDVDPEFLAEDAEHQVRTEAGAGAGAVPSSACMCVRACVCLKSTDPTSSHARAVCADPSGPFAVHKHTRSTTRASPRWAPASSGT